MEPEGPDQTFNLATQITHFPLGLVPIGELAWSPDGSKIAFERGSANSGSNALFVVNADGTSANATEIPTAEGGGTPTFCVQPGHPVLHGRHQSMRLDGLFGTITPQHALKH